MRNAPFQNQDNRSNANDQAPFGSPLPRRDPLGAVLHLATRGRQNVSGIFFIDLHEVYARNPVCRQIVWCGETAGLLLGWKIGDSALRTEAGVVGKRCGHPLESGNRY